MVLVYSNNFIFVLKILPQAICTRYGLTVGATMAPFVRLLLWLFFPIAYPISKVHEVKKFMFIRLLCTSNDVLHPV